MQITTNDILQRHTMETYRHNGDATLRKSPDAEVPENQRVTKTQASNLNPRDQNRTQEMDSVSAHAVVEKINTSLETLAHTNVNFEVDDDSGRMIARVVDSQSGDVIRQIPAEEMLELSRRIEDLRGIIFDKQA